MQFDIPTGHLSNEFANQHSHFQPSYLQSRVKSESISDQHESSSHISDASSRFASQTPQPLPSYTAAQPSFSYTPSHSGVHANPMMGEFPPPSTSTEHIYQNAPLSMADSSQSHMHHYQAPQQSQAISPIEATSNKLPPPKTFPCSTCGKCFARRSDLARHERIHSGIRPHVCTYENCGKQFIQRSALTVHYRVHTGEKPHMCERCGKSFSDSSSLARHRRIHSGKRPYKCPYADCQKTFTRRTTLTRHQAQHTGTVEEAAAATAAALASRVMIAKSRNDLDGVYSQHVTPVHSPTYQRTLSVPPLSLPTVQTIHRQTTDMGYPSPIHTIPHLRTDGSSQPSPPGLSPLLSQNYVRSPTSTVSGPLPTSNGPIMMNPQRQSSLTSHPSTYSSASVLDAQTPSSMNSMGQSSHHSPHIASSAGWQSPTHSALTTPTSMEGYVYSDSQYPVHQSHLYYSGPHTRRPHVEGDSYEPKQGPGMWAASTMQ